MTPTPLPTSCHMCHFQNFDEIDSFLKAISNIFILGNLIVGWCKKIIKQGTDILHQIYRFKEC